MPLDNKLCGGRGDFANFMVEDGAPRPLQETRLAQGFPSNTNFKKVSM